MKTKYAKPIAVLAVIFFPVTILIIIGTFLWAVACGMFTDVYKFLMGE